MSLYFFENHIVNISDFSHFITFNNDKNVMIVANIAATTIEIIDKIKSIYTLLPFFLKKGIIR